MEEEKAAAYYDELTRKGEGAAKFKQGLGFTSNDAVPKPASSLVSSSSFLSQFVKASSTTTTTTTTTTTATTTSSDPSEPDKKAQLQSIQNKLKKKPTSESRVSEKTNHRSPSRDNSDRRKRRSRSRSRDRYRERDRDRDSRRRSRSRERYNRYNDRDRSDSDGDRGRDRDRRKRERERGRRRSRSVSPYNQRRSEVKSSDVRERGKTNERTKGKNAGVDYAKLIDGYDNMAPAERVKAQMKLQLSETAARDSEKGVGWERFEFDKYAPLDDEEAEVAEDDASLVKHIGQSFRFSAVESKREEQIQAAHDEAMFGATTAPPPPPPTSTDSEPERENEKEVDNKKDLASSLLSETVLAKQKGSWRDRVRRP